MKVAPMGGRSRVGRWVLAAVLVGAVAAFYAAGLDRHLSWTAVRDQVAGWQGYVRDHPVAAVAVFFCVYVVVTGLSIPVAAALSLAAGILFGRWVGTGLVSVAATAGATLAFLSSRYVLRGWVRSRFGDRLRPVERGVERDGAYYLFTLRLIPLIPYFLINLGMGLTPIPVRTFALVSWVGMLPVTFLYVNAGAVLPTIEGPGDVLSAPVLVSLALLGLVPLAARLALPGRGRVAAYAGDRAP